MQSLLRRVRWGRPEEKRGISSMGSSQSRNEVPSLSSRAHLPPLSSSSQSWPAEPEYDTPVYQAPAPKRTLGRRLSRKYSHITDQFTSVEQVQQALGQSGLESSNLIVGIDFTKSNEWTGKHSFNRRSLHAIGNEPNPYEQAISIIGQTLSPFDEDNLIPCFGFGDASTHDQDVFSFFPDHRPCAGFEEALARYRMVVPRLRLAGPTSFAPIIDAAVNIVENTGGQYHVLIIIADGQVTRSIDTEQGNLSPQERSTIESIVNASAYPLSIVLVGVGDGPWDMMREFDDNIPARSFDNFQFVNFSQIMQRSLPTQQKEALFALSALMEIPQQYKATLELGILGQQTGRAAGRKPLPPPPAVMAADGLARGGPGTYGNSMPQASGYGPIYSQGFGRQSSQYPEYSKPSLQANSYPPASPLPYTGYNEYGYSASGYGTTPTAPTLSENVPARREDVDVQICPICLTDKKDMAFNCGHQTCRGCGIHLATCPICRDKITTRIRLY